jgi:phosphoribosylformimino-5-aminoimidazole carboxamide ribotide isomerase
MKMAAKNPEIVKAACKKFPGRIVVGIDAKNGFVATEGWVETSEISALELAKKFEDCGVAAIIYTDISRDGTLTGPDLEGTKQLVDNLKIPVIASGGMSSINDVRAVKGIGVEGVIIGRALYEGKITVEALHELPL